MLTTPKLPWINQNPTKNSFLIHKNLRRQYHLKTWIPDPKRRRTSLNGYVSQRKATKNTGKPTTIRQTRTTMTSRPHLLKSLSRKCFIVSYASGLKTPWSSHSVRSGICIQTNSTWSRRGTKSVDPTHPQCRPWNSPNLNTPPCSKRYWTRIFLINLNSSILNLLLILTIISLTKTSK